jgi:hypothetical protein
VRERRAWTTKCRRGATDLARLVGRADASGSPAEAGGLILLDTGSWGSEGEKSMDDEVSEGSNGSGAVGGQSGRQRVAGGGWRP